MFKDEGNLLTDKWPLDNYNFYDEANSYDEYDDFGDFADDDYWEGDGQPWDTMN